MCFKLCQYLSVSEIFNKLALLNKGFCQIVNKMNTMRHLWLSHFVFEFSSLSQRKQLVQDLELIGDPDHCFTYLEDHAVEFIEQFPDLKHKYQELKQQENLATLEFDLLKFSLSKQTTLRRLLIELLDQTRDQKNQTGFKQEQFLCPYDRRFEFEMQNNNWCLPKDLPFELFVWWRSFREESLNSLSLSEYMSEYMFNFDDELIYQNVEVDEHHLQYLLIQPITACCILNFVKHMMGREDWPYVPLAHTKRCP